MTDMHKVMERQQTFSTLMLVLAMHFTAANTETSFQTMMLIMVLVPPLLVIDSTVLSYAYKYSRTTKLKKSDQKHIITAHAFAIETIQITTTLIGVLVTIRVFLEQLEYETSVLHIRVPHWFVLTVTILLYLATALFIDLIDNKIQLGTWHHPHQCQTLLLTRSKLMPWTVRKRCRGPSLKTPICRGHRAFSIAAMPAIRQDADVDLQPEARTRAATRSFSLADVDTAPHKNLLLARSTSTTFTTPVKVELESMPQTPLGPGGASWRESRSNIPDSAVEEEHNAEGPERGRPPPVKTGVKDENPLVMENDQTTCTLSRTAEDTTFLSKSPVVIIEATDYTDTPPSMESDSALQRSRIRTPSSTSSSGDLCSIGGSSSKHSTPTHIPEKKRRLASSSMLPKQERMYEKIFNFNNQDFVKEYKERREKEPAWKLKRDTRSMWQSVQNDGAVETIGRVEK